MVRVVVSAASVAAMLLASAAHAAPPLGLRDARVGAKDPAKVAAFYEAVLGMKEVLRYDRPGQLEIILGFGATVDAAKASPSPRIIVITPPADNGADGVSHMVLNVPNIEEAVGKVVANGGSIERPATKSTTSANIIAMIKDPAGNRVEFIKEP
jgi:predicted enzyme related to lactoylglutathione lyase